MTLLAWRAQTEVGSGCAWVSDWRAASPWLCLSWGNFDQLRGTLSAGGVPTAAESDWLLLLEKL